MSRKQKVALGFTIVLISLLIIVLGGYLFLKARYPLEYQDTVQKYAEEYDLDPYLVCAFIWTESKFDAKAVSEVGAVGLMQIMPETGAWIGEKIDREITEDMLTDPEVNIQLGCWYMHYLLDRFDGDLTKMTAAYNAGPNRIDDWLDDPSYSPDGDALETIPFEETHNYVQRVEKAYEIYKLLYKL